MLYEVITNLDMQTSVQEQFDPENQVVRKENTQENQVVSSETSKQGVAGEEANVSGGNQNAANNNLLSSSNRNNFV